MNLPGMPDPMTMCLVCDDAVVEAALRASCPPPHRVDVFSRQGIVNEQHTISEHGRVIVRAAADSDVVLVDWAFDEAPALNTLSYHVRREQTAPVFMLCREGSDAMASAIAAGADDALAFPIYLPYLQAKVLSYHRLVTATRKATPGNDSLADHAEAPTNALPPVVHEVRAFDALRLDLSSHRFFVRNEEVELTPREFALLAYLIDRADVLCTRDQILDAVWGINFDTGTNMVDVYMYFLRKKLEAFGLKDMIETVRGHGYRLVHFEPLGT